MTRARFGGLFILEPYRAPRYESRMKHSSQQDGTPEQRAVVDRAQAAIDAFQRALGRAGITPQSAREYLKRFGGDAALRRADDHAAAVLQRIGEQAARDRFNAVPGAPVPRGLLRHGRI
jgi:hypothetical protein